MGDALSLAQSAAAHYRGRPGVYGDNDFDRQRVGKLGETGVADWFEMRGWVVDRTYKRASEPHPDIRVSATPPDRAGPRVRWPPSALAIEVKTWRDRTWAAHGRTLSPRQMPGILDGDMLIWCRLPEGQMAKVILEGWTWCSDLVVQSEARWVHGVRPELRIADSALRSMKELADPEDAPARPIRREDAALLCRVCGGSVRLGHCWACARGSESSGPEWVFVSGTGRHFHLPSRDEIEAAHGGWPFRHAVHYRPLVESALERAACGFCFPDDPS